MSTNDRAALTAFFAEVKREDDATRAAMNRWWGAFNKSLGAEVALAEGRATLTLTKELGTSQPPAARTPVARDVCGVCAGKFTTSPGSKGLRSGKEPTHHANCESF